MTTLKDFDFMADPPTHEVVTPLVPIHTPTIEQAVKMTSKRFAQCVLDVFDDLGGAEWLLEQAEIDPKGYMSMLTKMIPKSLTAEDLGGLTIRLINEFGQTIEISPSERGPALPASAAPKAAGGGPVQLGQADQPIRTATGGNPNDQTPDVVITDTF